MIERVRFDDCLWVTSDPKMRGRELQKFTKYISWCKDLPCQLSPAILCQDIEKIPGGVEYVRKGTEEGLFYPDLHGFDHGPYGSRSQAECEEHLEQAFEWFDANLGVVPIRWVTPHGANSPEIQAAAGKYNLVVEDTRYPVIDQKEADNALRKSRNSNVLNGLVIMAHWWERGLRLYRIARILQHGSVDAAMATTRGELEERDWRICWSGW